MAFSEKHHRDRGVEDDLWIDLAILSFLREEILLGNLDFVSLTEMYRQGLFSDLDCSWERFRRRSLYQVGLGFAEPRIIYNTDWERVDTKKQTGYLPPLRVTPAGFMHIPELEKEAKKYEWFNRYFTKFQELIEKVTGMKGAIVVGITGFLIITIFIFDIKVSKIIEKIPILSSIIDTQVLADFEAINEKDEFYKALISKDIDTSSSISSPSSSKQDETTTIPEITSGWIDFGSDSINDSIKWSSASTETEYPEPAAIETKRSFPIPQFLKKELPRGAQIVDIKVRAISAIEKMFRIELSDGGIRDIKVKKYDGKYQIVME